MRSFLRLHNTRFVWIRGLSRRSEFLRCLVLAILWTFAAGGPVGAEVLLPALSSSSLDPEIKGLILVEELNCAACHAGDPSLSARSKKAPRLADVGSRVNPKYLEAYLRDPQGTQPGTTMPDVLSSLSAEERALVAKSISQFLLSLKKNDFGLEPPDAVAGEHGRRLFHSRGCAACHSPRDERGKELLTRNSAPLGPLEKKYSFKSLVEFLRQPHASRPSGRMPDLRLADEDLRRIAHFLLRETRVPGHLAYTLYGGKVWEGLGGDQVTAERAGYVKDFALASLGGVHHHTAIQYDGWIHLATSGSHSFFMEMNGGSLFIDGKPVIQQDPSDRREVKQLTGTAELAAGWHSLRLTYFHTGYEPKFNFEMEGPGFARQAIPSSMLSVSDQVIPAFQPPALDPGLVSQGREYFGRYGCANCHEDLGVAAHPSIPFASLAPSQGCIGETTGRWPRFDLNAEQRRWLALALSRAARPQLNDRQMIDKTLVTFNCIACHERAGLGGIAPERNGLFTGTQPAMGDQGRLPPPLTHVGAKLTSEWMVEVLLHGKRQRPYLDASMPQFGEPNVGHLVALFGKVDTLEKAPVPEVTNLQEFKEAGREMMGATGLGCILCHEFNGQKSGEVGAVDLSTATLHLQKNWFHLYLRQPSRFHPTVIMPSYWPDGKSVRTNLLGGDAARQIEALWSYLEDGGRARKPDGLSRQSSELRVADTTEICRGQSPIGYRGIAVGYPERISLTFDSEEMALRQLWKGEFANINLGSFHPRGSEMITFSQGIPFHRLSSLEENWPYKGKTRYAFPQDHGYQFRGYHIDAARRPTFLYHYGEITVEDYFEDTRDPNGKAYFKRRLSFETPVDAAPFYFRAATGSEPVQQDDRHFVTGPLQLRITSDHRGIVRQGNPGEVLILMNPPKGRSILTLEYQW